MKNLFVIKALAEARTASKDPLQKFNFAVSIPDYTISGGFQKASGLSAETGVVEYDEAGFDSVHKLPGKKKYGEVTLEKGVFKDVDLFTLWKDASEDEDFRSTIVITQKNRLGNKGITYTLHNAWVSKWEGTDFDATSEDVAVEKITIQCEKITRGTFDDSKKS